MAIDERSSADADLVLAHSEPDPLFASVLLSEFERLGLEFATRDVGIDPTFGVTLQGAGLEFWVNADDLALARHVVASALPEAEVREEDAPFDEADLSDDVASFDPFPTEDLPTLFLRRTEGGAFLLVGPSTTYARVAPAGSWRTGATVQAHARSWDLTATSSYPGQLFVDGYLADNRLVLDMTGDEPAELVLADEGEPVSPIRSADGEVWETEEDWIVRLHEASGPRTTRWRVEIDPAFTDRPEMLLLVTIAAFARNRLLSQPSHEV